MGVLQVLCGCAYVCRVERNDSSAGKITKSPRK